MLMKKNVLLYMAAVAGLFLVGCAKEKGLEPETAPRQMRFAVSVDGTKAGMDADALKNLGEFYIKVKTVKQVDPSYDYLDIIRWDEKSVAWVPFQPMYWKNEEAAIQYISVASGWLEDLEEPEPFNTVLPAIFTEEGGTLAIFDDQSYSLTLEASDLLRGFDTMYYTDTQDGVIPVEFSHALAKVNFQLNLAEGYFDNYIGLDDESPIEDISINGVHLAYNFKALTGVVTVDSNYPAAAVEPFESNYVSGTEADKISKATFEAILIPETFAVGALELDFSILGENFKWTNDKELTLAQGKEYTIPVAVSYEGQPGPPVPPAPLSGNFTINANGDKVNFSRGNLQATYDGADWSWTFAENQWDYLGEGGANLLIVEDGVLSAPGTVDYFHWSVEDSYFGIYPVMKNGKFANYEKGEFRDWGEALGFGWRTLSEPEWDYLLNGRASGSTVNAVSDARYTRCVINTDGTAANGLILFPDGVTIEASEATAWGLINTFTPFSSAGWRTKCTTEQWAALAAKGCVFLPTAGYRGYYTGDTKYWYATLMNEAGYYWTSTKTTDYNAYALSNRYDGNTQYKILPDNDISRTTGNSVRLVKPVPSN